MRRFFLAENFVLNAHLTLSPEEGRHLATVLRGNVGTEIQLLNGDGGLAIAEVVEIAGSRKSPQVVVKINSVENTVMAGRKIALYVACPRTKQMELILRQATELGVYEIHPIITEFTVSKPDKNPEKWENVITEAVKQSGNPFRPKLFPVETFSQAVRNPNTPQFGWYGAVPENGINSTNHNEEIIENSRLALWIGPEGGFSSEEVNYLKESITELPEGIHNSFLPLTIGHHILRIETAVTAGLAILSV